MTAASHFLNEFSGGFASSGLNSVDNCSFTGTGDTVSGGAVTVKLCLSGARGGPTPVKNVTGVNVLVTNNQV